MTVDVIFIAFIWDNNSNRNVSIKISEIGSANFNTWTVMEGSAEFKCFNPLLVDCQSFVAMIIFKLLFPGYLNDNYLVVT
jgi:hypothetical protein